MADFPSERTLRWALSLGFATGHADTEQDLLDEVGAQIKELRLQLAGKDEVIKMLKDDIKFHRKEWKDQMKQDQGLPEKGE